MNNPVVLGTELPLPVFRRGKVRDVYEWEDKLLIVASDRISAFDCVIPTGIPDKGRVLAQMSLFWFETLAEAKPNHVFARWEDIEGRFPAFTMEQREQLRGRTVVGVRTEPLPVECVVRGYISGSLWKEYRQARDVPAGSDAVHLHGYRLPTDLRESDRLAEPIFTPATKESSGHDINISFDDAARIVGGPIAEELRARSIALYNAAARHALARGIIIADTKFEFGVRDGKLILIDEILTPDSSRFWEADAYEPGRGQASYDKQFVRDYLETLDWDKTPPAPPLPDDIVHKTRARYVEAYERLTGKKL